MESIKGKSSKDNNNRKLLLLLLFTVLFLTSVGLLIYYLTQNNSNTDDDDENTIISDDTSTCTSCENESDESDESEDRRTVTSGGVCAPITCNGVNWKNMTNEDGSLDIKNSIPDTGSYMGFWNCCELTCVSVVSHMDCPGNQGISQVEEMRFVPKGLTVEDQQNIAYKNGCCTDDPDSINAWNSAKGTTVGVWTYNNCEFAEDPVQCELGEIARVVVETHVERIAADPVDYYTNAFDYVGRSTAVNFNLAMDSLW